MSYSSPVIHDRIAKLCSWAKWLSAISAILLSIWIIFLALNPAALGGAVIGKDAALVEVFPSLGVMALAWLTSMLPSMLFVYVLYCAVMMFTLVSKGQYLSSSTRAFMARAGKLTLIASVLEVLCKPIAVALLTSANPEGARFVSVSVTAEQVFALMLGILFAIFALLLSEMALIDEDNKAIL